MKKSYILLLMVAILAIGPALGVAANNSTEDHDHLTRGEFFKSIVDLLELTPSDKAVELPTDVAADSPYADSVRVLIQRQILNGYPDGTFGLDNPITRYEASLVIARFLGIEDSEAIEFLTSDLGLALGNERNISVSLLTGAVEKALVSEQSALDLVERSSLKQLELLSYRSEMKQNISMNLKEEYADMEELNFGSILSTTLIDFHMETGMYLNTTMVLPEPLPTGEQEMQMEQYIVPKGLLMKMMDPTSGEEMWLNMGSETLNFEELIQMQTERLDWNAQFNNKYVFYRDLGTEEIDGTTARKVSFNSKITPFEEIFEMMGNIAQDPSMLQGLEDMSMPEMSMTIAGTMWIDAETELPIKTSLNMLIQYGDTPDMPFDEMKLQLEMTFFDYNEVDPIVLPEAAKDAESFPSFDVIEEEAEEATSDSE